MKKLLTLLLLLTCGSRAAEWRDISDPVTSQVKPGYAGPTAGVVVLPGSGDVFMVVNDQGLWRSTDGGAHFTRCDGGAIGGRCETGYALQADPAGKRLACFMIYGSSATTTDGGQTWSKFGTSHLDCGSVDWADTGKRFLAIRHESGGMLTTSTDAGQTWTDLSKGFFGCGVIDNHTFIAMKEKEPGIFRSEDAGMNWTKVFEGKPLAAVPVSIAGKIYWPAGKGLLVSADQGKTWTTLAEKLDCTHGPLLSPEPNHFIVIGKAGFNETIDAGKNWKLITALPPGFTSNRTGPNFTWDPKARALYASTMNKPTLKYVLEN